MKILNALLPAYLLLTLSVVTPSILAADNAEGKRAEEFAKAAQNYEVAANARVETADILLEFARELRSQEHADETERRKNMKSAGLRELQAGNLLASALSGYDKAAQAWTRAGSAYKKAGNQEKGNEMKSAFKIAQEAGTAACQVSAESFEFSAEAFSTIDLSRMAGSSDKAASMRERLANRIK